MTDRAQPRKTNSSPIARKRMERRLTQAQLAEMVGCYAKDISRWETGERTPGVKTLLKLAVALECALDELVAK